MRELGGETMAAADLHLVTLSVLVDTLGRKRCSSLSTKRGLLRTETADAAAARGEALGVTDVEWTGEEEE